MSKRYAALSEKALEPNELTLTCKGMSSVNWNWSDSDFEFVFGHNRVCSVHSVLAEFLSPKVAGLRRCDPLCSFYTVQDPKLFHVFESLVSSLLSGTALRVENLSFTALLRLAQELGNTELFSSLLGMINPESLSLKEATFLLRAAPELGTSFSDRFGNLGDFIASRFYELGKEILDHLDLETAQILLSSPSLKIEDEDSLYDFVRSRSEKDLRFASLFEFVYFDYVSVNRIKNFAAFANEKLLGNINSSIWSRICRRLIFETEPEAENPHNCKDTGKKETTSEPGIKFVYDLKSLFTISTSEPLEGIIAHLTRECGGNVHDKGIVNVTAKSVLSNKSSYHPKNAVDLGTDSTYESINHKNTWICYDFKERRVIPTSYSVRSYGAGPGYHHLKSWVIEVSNGASSWTEIDRRDNNDLNDKYAIANFKIAKVPRESFRFFRLRQTGPNHHGDYYVEISSMEIFGTLVEK